MPEPATRDRLQPSLLDRLTDDEPGRATEPRERRVLSLRRLRESVLRDLAWLLNTGCLAQTDDLTAFPEVERSVLNYGMRDLAGVTVSSTRLSELERAVREAIVRFEPRVLAGSVKVRAVAASDQMNRNALAFQIEGQLWAEPVPLHLLLETRVDLESGDLTVMDATDARPD
jgi:type VI secretion system protein ImpF